MLPEDLIPHTCHKSRTRLSERALNTGHETHKKNKLSLQQRNKYTSRFLLVRGGPPANISPRLRHTVSGEYAAATLAGSLVFHAASAALVFLSAVSAVKGGRGCCQENTTGNSGMYWSTREARRGGGWVSFFCSLRNNGTFAAALCVMHPGSGLVLTSFFGK